MLQERNGFALIPVLLIAAGVVIIGVLGFGVALKYVGVTTPTPSVREAQNVVPIVRTADISAWKTYRSVEQGYEFDYPPTWMVDESGNMGRQTDVFDRAPVPNGSEFYTIPKDATFIQFQLAARFTDFIQISNDLLEYVKAFTPSSTPEGMGLPWGNVEELQLGVLPVVRVEHSETGNPAYYVKLDSTHYFRVWLQGQGESETVLKIIGSLRPISS